MARHVEETGGVVRGNDVAARFLATLDSSIKETPVTPQEARKILWKIDLTILPLIWISAIVASTDKIIISNAAIYGMKADTHLVGDQYAWVGSMFSFGYLLFEYPTSFLIQRLPVARFFTAMVFTWAILMCCTAATHDFASLAAVRFIMGMAEAGMMPVCTIITVMWWKNGEQPFRVACWMSQLSSIFNGTVSYGIGTAHTPLAPWRLLFLVFGAFSLLWSLVLFLFLPDSPTQCRYLTSREKFICLHRVRSNNTGVEDKRIKWYQVRECVRDPKTWLLFTFAVAQNIPNGGIITFAALIVSSLGYTPLTTVLLGIPTGIIATLWSWTLAGCVLRKNKNIRCATAAAANLVTIACAVLMWKLPSSSKIGRLAAYYFFHTYWGPWIVASSLPMANTSGHSKKVTMNALYFVAYCLGNIVGPQVFRAQDAPEYAKGYVGIVGCLVVAMVAVLTYGAVCAAENRRRDNGDAAGEDVRGEAVEAFSDLTDKEKKGFRYTF